MKKFKNIMVTAIFLGLAMSSLQAELNEFGISDIIPAEEISSDDYAHVIRQRIAEELGDNFTLQDIFSFFPKIQAYYDYLLNTQNHDEKAMLLAKLALIDVKKAKMSPTIKANTVTPEDEHNLRIEIGKLNRQISPHQ
ncbi:hypothetical protein KBC04_03415 [Candidatus Babeliales bacterium]|nr:hypothetical protein [Candidatus Babeliales bacterium]MBP9843899.1 hypothetical protein [Candidatus Babeliales bacterium]